MSQAIPNGPQRNSQLLDTVLQIGETVLSKYRFESRWGRSFFSRSSRQYAMTFWRQRPERLQRG